MKWNAQKRTCCVAPAQRRVRPPSLLRLSPLLSILMLLSTVLLAAGVVGAASEPQPQVHVEVETPQPVLVGQQARVVVEVLVPNFFLSPPRFPLLEIPGALVTEAPDRAQNTTQTIDGVSYSGIRKTYLVTPQQAGTLGSASARITLRYAAEPGKPAADATVVLPPVELTVNAPAGATTAGGTHRVVARLQLAQTFDRDTAGLRVGDTLTRTVVTSAEHAQAMMIPAPSFAAPEGVRVYGHDPVLRDVAQDPSGFDGGRRTDQATYLFERAGTVALPAVELQWLDPATGQSEVASAPALTVTVAANPDWKQAARTALAPSPQRGGLRWVAWAGAVLLLIACAFLLERRAWPRIVALRTRRRAARVVAEPVRFAALERACRTNQASAAYRALDAWARSSGFASVGDLCTRQPSLRTAVDALEAGLFARAPSAAAWDGSGLLAATSKARPRRAAGGKRWSLATPVLLPPLNP